MTPHIFSQVGTSTPLYVPSLPRCCTGAGCEPPLWLIIVICLWRVGPSDTAARRGATIARECTGSLSVRDHSLEREALKPVRCNGSSDTRVHHSRWVLAVSVSAGHTAGNIKFSFCGSKAEIARGEKSLLLAPVACRCLFAVV